MRRDLACAVAGLILAVAYWLAADALPRSLLSDGVGADGLPKILAIILAALALLIAIRSPLSDKLAQDKPGEQRPASHGRALGIAAIGALYVALVPLLGYFIAITLLTASSALYYGGPRRVGVAVFALATAGLLWLVFSAMLGIALPKGAFF